MKVDSRILLFTCLFTGLVSSSFADRGTGKKKGNRVTVNIKTPISFSSSLNFNLRNGLKYTGSFLAPNTASVSNSDAFNYNSFVTYQKGNSVYIIPYKQKVIVADYHQGFVGSKLIIKMR